MSQDYVDLDPQQVANGLALWEQAATNLQTHWDSLTGQIDAALGGAPWGGDEPGTNFRAAFVEEGKAGEFTETGRPIVQQVIDTGTNVRTSAEASLGADQMQAAEVDIEVPTHQLPT